MFDLLLKVIALGIASAMSPVIFGVALSILASGKGRMGRITAYLAGGILSAAIVLLAGALIGNHAFSFKGSREVAYLDLFIGLVFIIFASMQFLGKERGFKAGKGAGPGKWLAISFILNITNLDAEVLYFTAAKEVFQSGIPPASQSLLVLLGTLFFLSPTLLPLAAFIAMPERFGQLLKPVGAAMAKYGKYIVSLIFAGFGAYLFWRGLAILVPIG